ncbi:DUF4214 domain-containing protein [Methylobacterium thuringiense]|uniref:DUF4214 domain-containing protein n=1 Tax=Methylobacterium thuringiense TaxID=1003091 RepID=UPI001EDE3C15|nr:DUF4214 domain-containing protein [Methylobacterium thuringiense]
MSHWIIFGTQPTQDEITYWQARVQNISLYNMMQTMHQALRTSQQPDWRRIYGILGVSGPNSRSSSGSPTLTVIRTYLKHCRAEPKPQEILIYLKALLRRPTDMQSFTRHVARRLQHKNGQSGQKPSLIRNPLVRRVPTTLIRAEILAIETTLRVMDGSYMALPLIRAFSLIPCAEHRPMAPDTLSVENNYDRALISRGIDTAEINQRLLPLLTAADEVTDRGAAEKISAIMSELLTENDNEIFLILLYRILLKRDPDELGLEHHISALNLKTIKPSDLVANFMASEEYRTIRENYSRLGDSNVR